MSDSAQLIKRVQLILIIIKHKHDPLIKIVTPNFTPVMSREVWRLVYIITLVERWMMGSFKEALHLPAKSADQMTWKL